MNRRELIQWISAGTVGIAVSKSPAGGVEAEAAVAEVKELPNEKAILVFSLTTPLAPDRINVIRENLVLWLQEKNIDTPAILLPYGLSLDVIRYPATASVPGVPVSSKE